MLRAATNHEIVRPTLHHVGLTTVNLEPMLEWYGEVLGMTVNQRSAKPAGPQTPAGIAAAWVTNDEANHRIGFISLEGLRNDPDRYLYCRVQHIAFEYETIDDLLATYGRLKRLGIEPVLAADHGAATSFYYHDPDRNCVELFVDNFGDWKKSSECLRTSPEFAERPIGAYVDPAAMLAARATGMSVEALHRCAYAGLFPPQKLMDATLLL